MGPATDLSQHGDYHAQVEKCRQAVTLSIKTLLETKHLYQRALVTFPPLIVTVQKPNTWVLDQSKTDAIKRKVEGPWSLMGDWVVRRVSMHVAEESEWLSFDAPTLKIFCSNGCNRVEAFNPVGAVDCLPDGRGNTFAFDDGKCAQVFSLAYLCQSCKKIPELFFVRRDGNRLTLVGRTPIEQVEMPNVIPKSMQRFYTGAIVAHQSGHTLAGVFMLRTLIEQWARCETKATSEDFADKVIDAYVAGLPEDFKRRFPALRDTYGHLSLDIHGAVGSEQAFEKSRSEIIEHFDARRLFNLDGRSS